MKNVKQKIKNRSGVSLVEMIFCVLLFTLAFLVGVSGLLFAFNSTEKLQKAADEQKVSDTIMNRIEGELAGMVGEGSVYLSTTNDVISFTCASGIPVYIATEGNDNEKTIVIHYWETYTSASNTGKPIAESNWTFDSGIYRDYAIQNLIYSSGSHNGKLTVTVDLTLINKDTKQTYNLKRTICCYNRPDASVDKTKTTEELKSKNPTQSDG